MRPRIWLSAALIALAAPAHASVAASPPPPPPPKLIVALSIDQFSADLFDRYRDSFTGGLARLAGGVRFTGYQSHAATETCPGHSTILTGRHPSATGIVANSWFDAGTGSTIYCVSVADTADPLARGPQRLMVDTFGDWLKRAQPGARSVSISGKDRAAIMLGGHHADAVYWWVDGSGFATSAFAGPAGPAVARPAAVFDAALFAGWRATPPSLWPAVAPPRCAAIEQPYRFGQLALSGRVPPDAATAVEGGPDFMARSDFQDQLRASAAFDPLTLEFATSILDQDRLGHGPATDLLAVSLSATDYVGHRYGNGGAEMCVQLDALDRALTRFLAHLDGLGVPYLVVLTADHGGTDAAERAAAHGLPAARLDPGAFVKTLNDHLKRTLALDFEPIVGDDPQQLVVNTGTDTALRARVRDAAIAWLKARPEVSSAFGADEIARAVPPPGKPAPDLTLAERFNESAYAGRSGDIAVAYKPYTSIGMPRSTGDVVAGHGSPWDYDRRVPILFWWPGVTPAARAEPIETVDIAPTLAAIAGIATPIVDGRCLASVAGACPRR